VRPDEEKHLTALMRRAQRGDEDAYAELLGALASLARRFVEPKVGRSLRDDVVQEILISVDRARHTFDAGRPLAPWFYAIVRRRVIDMQRRQGRIARFEMTSDLAQELPASMPAREVDEVDMELVRIALAKLPPRQRDIVEAIQLHDESTRTVASRLGMSQSAVKVAAHRGYCALRRLLLAE